MSRLTWREAHALEEAALVKRGHDANPHRRIGLAISGGGIRSATFALGVLEALKERGILRQIAYLSTVSGGGYIGAWLSANCARHPEWADADWRDSIRHLRQYSSYLMPVGGFFSTDTWATFTTWLRNTLLVQVGVVLAIACVMILPRPLFILFRTWPDAGQFQWLTVVLFLYSAVGIAGNQLQKTGHRRLWLLRADRWLPSAVVAVLSLLSTLSYAMAVGFEPFRSGPVPYGQAAPIAFGLVIGAFFAQPAAIRLTGLLSGLGGIDPPTEVNYTQQWVQRTIVVPLLVAGFLAAATLWHESTGALGAVDSYGGLFRTAWRYWPLPFTVLFQSLLLLSFCSIGRPRHLRQLGIAALGGIVSVVVLHALLCAIMLLLHPWAQAGQTWRGFIWVPALVISSLVLTIWALIGALGRQTTPGVVTWWSRLSLWLLFYAAGWVVIMLAAVYSRTWIDWVATGPAAIVTVGGWIATTLGGLLTGHLPLVDGGRQSSAFARVATKTLVTAAPLLLIFGLLVAVAYALDLIIETNSSQSWASAAITGGDFAQFATVSLALFGVLLAITLLIAWRIDLNEFGLNALYRQRLVRCYLGASRFAPGQRRPLNFTGFDDDDDLQLEALHGEQAQGPFHIVNCALNLGGSSDLALHARPSASFTLTPLTCGSGYTLQDAAGHSEEIGFCLTSDYCGRDGSPTLGQAVAVSGAAVSPNMGHYTSPTLAFALTLFNLRLGWWFPNPSHDRTQQASQLFNLSGLVSEFFGGATTTSDFLMVSDGGHFENLGAYELVRRRCGTIIVSDGECDPDLIFSGLSALIRLCEVDFGVRIEIDVEPIRPVGTPAWSRRRYAVGRIKWGDGSPDGTLIYLKASMRGRERITTLHYKWTHAAFPHESTGNQFHREDQFESYRDLGRDVALEALDDTAVSESA
jgi:hypothetical protein